MRLILLTFFLFPFLVIGQMSSESGGTTSADGASDRLLADRIAEYNTTPSAIDFGLKQEQASAKIHPNPSSIDLYVTLTGNGNTGKVIVYDILGNIILEGETFELSGGSSTWSHNVSQWHSGTYVVRVLQDDSVVKSLRFIKS